jgi:ATP-dependent helicase YprA (DUF1998 family)
MQFDAERVRRNVEAATTEDLLDRATVQAAGMEPEALDLIEAELRRRGVTAEQQKAHGERGADRWFIRPDGTVISCSFCGRPAVADGLGWHRLWGVLPLIRRRVFYCGEHRPDARAR